MSIASEITRLQNAKSDIKTAIESKGVEVPSNAKLDEYDTYIENISGGGDVPDLSEYFVSEITHNTTSSNNYRFLMKKNGPIYVSNNVTSLKNCFEGIITETLDVSQMDMSNIINVNSMFLQTSAKEIIGLNNWNTSNISNFASMFYESIQITKLDLSSFTLGNKETYSMGSMFSGTNKLALLDISNIELNKVTSFTNMFSNCGSQCLQSDGAYADGIPYIYVKDATSQNWILTQNNGHPSTWTTNNVIVKSN